MSVDMPFSFLFVLNFSNTNQFQIDKPENVSYFK